MLRPPNDNRAGDTPLVSIRGAALALILAALLCWPIWAGRAIYVMPDTVSYLKAGEAIYSRLAGWLDFTTISSAGALDTPLVVDDRGGAPVGRSFTYPALFYPVHLMFGAGAFALLQGAATIFAAFGLVSARALARPEWLIAGFGVLALATPLPWAASYLVPDLFAAMPILFAATLGARWDGLTPRQRMVLAALAAFASSTHYGTAMLTITAVTAALLIRVIARQRVSRAALLTAVGVMAFAPMLNLAASSATLERASTAPLRLPILLARSLEDGPARWYLEKACPAAPLTLCEILGNRIPDNAGEFLWSAAGIADATPQQMDAIRAEEGRVLWAAFRAYPVQQSWSLARNAARQTVLIGIDQMEPAERITDDLSLVQSARSDRLAQTIEAFDPWLVAATWASFAVALATAAYFGIAREYWFASAIVLAGLLANAAIFGGLSAPVDRYQARVIWLPIAVLMIALADRRFERARLKLGALHQSDRPLLKAERFSPNVIGASGYAETLSKK